MYAALQHTFGVAAFLQDTRDRIHVTRFAVVARHGHGHFHFGEIENLRHRIFIKRQRLKRFGRGANVRNEVRRAEAENRVAIQTIDHDDVAIVLAFNGIAAREIGEKDGHDMLYSEFV